MKGQKIVKLKKAIRQFDENARQLNTYFEYSLIATNGMHAEIIKRFKEKEIDTSNLVEGGLALLGKSILLGLTNLEKRSKELAEAGAKYYKPWFIVLSNGQCYDNMDNPLVKLKDAYIGGKITYFPFALSSSTFDDRLDGFKKIKHPLIISNTQYDSLFNWIFETAKTRVSTPIEKSIVLESNCFEGWTNS